MSSSDPAWTLDPVTHIELEVPAYATADEAIKRAAQKRAGTFRTIRLFPDYSRLYPLWETGSDKYTVGAEDLGLSPLLALALRQWQALWEAECLFQDAGWSSEEARIAWLRDGDILSESLQREIWLFADVSAEYRPRSASEDGHDSE